MLTQEQDPTQAQEMKMHGLKEVLTWNTPRCMDLYTHTLTYLWHYPPSLQDMFCQFISVNSPFGLRRKLDKAHKAILSQNINEHPPDMTRLSLPVCLHPASHCITDNFSFYIKVYQKYLWGNKLKQTHTCTQTHLYLKKGDKFKKSRGKMNMHLNHAPIGKLHKKQKNV